MAVKGKLISLTGGLYTADCCGENINCRARGAFRHEHIKPTVGDNALIEIMSDGDNVISELDERKNLLIRPPMANLDLLFCAVASADPEPSTLILDKLITIAEHNKIEPVIVITKSELDEEKAQTLSACYKKCGFDVFVTSSVSQLGIDELREYIKTAGIAKTSAIAGVSGAGKSTLLNSLFPSLELETGELSKRISRGKNTTRRTELFRLSELCGAESGYFADTPGFSLLDFERFDFYDREHLPYVFREFAPYLTNCKYTKCSHTKEDGCAIINAVKNKEIPKSRHKSYISIFEDIKDKREWNKVQK